MCRREDGWMWCAVLCLALVMVAGLWGVVYAGRTDPALQETVKAAADDGHISISVIMRERIDYEGLHALATGLPKTEGRRVIREEATAFARESQSRLRTLVQEAAALGRARDIRYLHAVNVVRLLAQSSLVREIAALPEVETIMYNTRGYALTGLQERPESVDSIEPFAPRSHQSDTAWGVQWIGADDVWELGYRGQGVLVAIIDTGIWYYHSDLSGNMWTNLGEIPNNGIDDDENGYIDDYYGFNFDAHTSDPIDENGHGTHVSGTVAGDGTGGVLTGVAPEAHLMAIRVLDEVGWGEEANVWEAIEYAVDMGADILHGSIGWYHLIHLPDRAAWRDVCSYALAADVILSFSGGGGRPSYWPPDVITTPGDVPPPWLHPGQTLEGGLNSMMTVGATGYYNDDYAYFSSNGPVSWQSVPPWYDYPYAPGMGLIDPDICAPGVNINSTIMGGGYSGETWSGTSMAAPHNSGLIALLLSCNSALTPPEIDSIIEMTALDRGPAGKDNDYGAGRIQALEAIGTMVPRTWHVPSPECPTIQAGVDSAAAGDTVLVADGLYTGYGNRDIDFGGKAIVVMSENGPEVTIIDCQGSSLDPHRGFRFYSGEEATAVVRGFTIQNGYVTGGWPLTCGGAIHCVGSSPTIAGNIIRENTAEIDGGGIAAEEESFPIIVENMITDNHAVWGGGIAFWEDSDGIVISNTVSENEATYGGGISCLGYCAPMIVGNTIGENAGTYGGGISCWGESPATLVRNTITGNTAAEGGAIFCHDSYLNVTNSILWGDNAGIGPEVVLRQSGAIGISFTDVEGGSSAVHVDPGCFLAWGEGNIDTSPWFVWPSFDDYRLLWPSPCIDAGHPDSLDPDGTRCDMGAHSLDQSKTLVIYASVQALTVAPGQTGSVVYTIMNCHDEPQPTWWIALLRRPNGQPWPGNPLEGPHYLEMKPDSYFQAVRSYTVPLQCLLGTWGFRTMVGHPGNVFDQDGFKFTVVLPVKK